MNTDIVSSLEKNFGFSSFRPGQAEAITSLLKGQHTLVVMPTGSGKSLVYQLAALHLPGITLVISPLIALMKDQVDSLERHNIPATLINSSLASNEQNQRLKGLVTGHYRIIYIAPERLRNTRFTQALQHQKVSLLAIDEAHCISEWGHDFRPDYLHIAQFRAALGNPLTVALTATATPQVQDDIARLLNLTPVQRVVTGFNRPNLELEVRYIPDPTSRLKTLQELLTGADDGATIIYTGTRRDAEEVAEFVSTVVGIKTLHYHAGLPTEERTRIQDEFMAGDLSIVAATNAFGMGIDRPDVRRVIHYSLPGSLEAYYQEAGRAGRDELPAKAVLLYSPEDRALQEWFIENSTITSDDLRLLFEALRPSSERQESITVNQISALTGMQEVKVRVGLAVLERAGMLEHQGDEGIRLKVKLFTWKDPEIRTVIENQKQHQAHRKTQLEYMIAYAESNDCRRRIILEYFGDKGTAEADICCDNCQASKPVEHADYELNTLSQSERVALIILDTVRRSKHNVGSRKLTQILQGSKAKDILRSHYDKNTYYGKLAVFSQVELHELIQQLINLRYFKVIGGKYPVLHLTPQGETALHNKTPIPLKMPPSTSKHTFENRKAENQAGGTLEYTAHLLSQNLSIEQIAARRGLSPITIYSHAAKLISSGKINIDMVISKDIRQKVEAAIRQLGAVEYLYPIKNLLPEEITYEMIRCVVENWKLTQPSTGKVIHPPQGKVSSSDQGSQGEDPIANFLSRPHPRQLPGPWDAGWALGFHSQFSGANWKRSDAGELAYRLKYQDDLTVLPKLVEQAAALIADHPELAQVDEIIPVPASMPRAHDPVSGFAQALSKRLGLVYSPLLTKSRQTSPQKELHTLAQKRMNVDGAFALRAPIRGKRLLVVDDLFDSGATLEEIYRLLRKAGATKVCVLTLTRTIHSDA